MVLAGSDNGKIYTHKISSLVFAAGTGRQGCYTDKKYKSLNINSLVFIQDGK